MSPFVGRDNPVEDISRVLSDQQPRTRIRIISISGPGGVGKSYMLNHVLSGLDLASLNYLPLRVDANTSSVTLADLMVRDLIATTPPAISGDPQYFRVTREGWHCLQRMDADARAELEVGAKDDPELARMIGALYDGTVGLLEVLPKMKKASRVAKRFKGKDLEKLITVAQRSKAYREEKGNLFGLLPIGRSARERNLLRKDLSGRLAEYLTIDLAAILSGYRSVDWNRYLPQKVAGLDRCLVILDDYETLGSTLDDFLRQDFLPRLRKVAFDTLFVILGRDSVRDVGFRWEQYFKDEIVLDVRLAPLSDCESEKYLRSLGISDPTVIARILKDSLGLPYLLAAEAEWEQHGGGSALGLQTFVDRTTRWMSLEQRQWTIALAFLDEVNTDTVSCLLPDCNPVEVVEWFKQEPSIRSPEGNRWRMLPLIKSRIQASVKNDSPSRFSDYQERAEAARKQT